MLIEGNLLIGLLIGVSVAIVLAVIGIRYVVKNGLQVPTGSIFSPGSRGHSQASSEAEEDAESGEAMPPAEQWGDDLSLPSIDGLEDPFGEPEKKKNAVTPAPAKKGMDISGLVAVIKDLISTLFGRRKKKEEMKQDVKEIDEQLNRVLEESQNFGFDNPSGIKAPELSSMSDSQSLRDIDKEIRDQQRSAAEMRRPENPPQQQQQSIEGLNPYTQGGSLELTLPTDPAKAQEPARPQEQAKPDLSKQPIGPKPEAKGPENTFKGAGAHDATSDLLSEIAADSVKEVIIDLSIMKDLKDVPIACDELEKDLTGILGQVSNNAKMNSKKKK